MKSKTFFLTSCFPFTIRSKWPRGDQMQNKRRELRDDVGAQMACKGQWRQVKKKAGRWKEIILWKSLFISLTVRGSTLSDALRFDFTGCHFLSISSILFPSSPSPVLAAPFRTHCHHRSGVTAIFSTSDPLCGCSLWIVRLKDFLTGPWTHHSAFSLLCFSPLGCAVMLIWCEPQKKKKVYLTWLVSPQATFISSKEDPIPILLLLSAVPQRWTQRISSLYLTRMFPR